MPQCITYTPPLGISSYIASRYKLRSKTQHERFLEDIFLYNKYGLIRSKLMAQNWCPHKEKFFKCLVGEFNSIRRRRFSFVFDISQQHGEVVWIYRRGCHVKRMHLKSKQLRCAELCVKGDELVIWFFKVEPIAPAPVAWPLSDPVCIPANIFRVLEKNLYF